MPIASRKNLGWDKAKGRGYMSGKDVTWDGKDTNDHIEKWMKDICLLYTSPSPRDLRASRMPSSA